LSEKVRDTQELCSENIRNEFTASCKINTKPVKGMVSELLKRGVTLVTDVRKNMKIIALSLWDRAMLSRHFIIETINDQLKNISQVENIRRRSVHGFMLNVLGARVNPHRLCAARSNPSD